MRAMSPNGAGMAIEWGTGYGDLDCGGTAISKAEKQKRLVVVGELSSQKSKKYRVRGDREVPLR